MNYAYINGNFCAAEAASIGIQDMALQRAYGMFDYFKIMAGQPIFLEDHLDRFWESARQLRLPIAVTKQELTTAILKLIQLNQWYEAGIRLTLTAGYAADGYSIDQPNLIMNGQSIQLPGSISENGLKLVAHNHIRQLPQIKSIDYLMAVYLQDKVKAAGANELLYHQHGWISECPRANVFIITDQGVLATPAEGILNGITRKKVLQVAAPLMPIEIRPVHLDEFKTAREAFISSTTKIVHPVFAIDGNLIGTGKTGELSRTLFDAYLQLLPA
ncbi:aminotransferase class IV [Flavihumibacter sp. UBA7668]|uniref:aminotransferase class IV n=1 Tax=Flavihumibacter sp. UBA7668 TaxID=1946542 RepID=UPI0025BB388D|nr:aminotransferase class IV [Flavihumibacter sp. UBA7668]